MNNREKDKKAKFSSVQSILFTTLIILVFLGIVIAFYVLLNTEIKDNIIKNGELNAVSFAAEIDKYLVKGDDIVNLTAFTLDDMIKEKRSTDEMLDFIVAQTKSVLNIVYGESTGIYAYINGEYLDGVGWVPEEGYEPTERPWYIGAQERKGDVVVIDPYLDAQTHTILITLAKTLRDDSGVVAIDISLEKLQSITEDIVSGKSDMEIILDGNYQVIAHSDKEEVGKNYKEDDGSLGSAIVKALQESDENYYTIKHNNTQYIVYKVMVQNEWVSLSVIDATSIFARTKRPLLFTIFAGFLIVTVLLAIIIRSNKNGILAEKMKELAELQMKYAYQDQMTELKNRRAYAEQISNLMKEMPVGLYLVMLDVNGLKSINDGLGHEAGDELLVAAGKCIKEAFPETDDVYRLGGDEFCVITNGNLNMVEENLKNMDEATKVYRGKFINGFTISYGIGIGDTHSDISAVVKEADKRMYEYKENYYAKTGKDRRRKR